MIIQSTLIVFGTSGRVVFLFFAVSVPQIAAELSYRKYFLNRITMHRVVCVTLEKQFKNLIYSCVNLKRVSTFSFFLGQGQFAGKIQKYAIFPIGFRRFSGTKHCNSLSTWKNGKLHFILSKNIFSSLSSSGLTFLSTDSPRT